MRKTFVQCWPYVEDVEPVFYKCDTDVLCLPGITSLLMDPCSVNVSLECDMEAHLLKFIWVKETLIQSVRKKSLWNIKEPSLVFVNLSGYRKVLQTS